jgi:hypothetical protein
MFRIKRLIGTYQGYLFILLNAFFLFFRYAEEIGVNLLKTTHVFSPDSERSDKWIVECKTLGDANRMIEKQSLLFGRLVR